MTQWKKGRKKRKEKKEKKKIATFDFNLFFDYKQSRKVFSKLSQSYITFEIEFCWKKINHFFEFSSYSTLQAQSLF
jgi:hypothetical protein